MNTNILETTKNTTTSALEQLDTTLSAFNDELHRYVTFQDNTLTADALQDARESIRDQARTAALEQTSRIAGELADLSTTLSTEADTHRPHLDPDNVPELTRTTDAWQNNILPQLHAGRTWGDILPHITRDEALAIERFAPAWVRANTKMPSEAESQLNEINYGVWQRHADIATTSEGRDTINAATISDEAASTAASINSTIATVRDSSALSAARISIINALANLT